MYPLIFQTPDAQSLALVATVDLNAYGKANNKNPEHWIQVCDGSTLYPTMANH
jgi:hypothetical protein